MLTLLCFRFQIFTDWNKGELDSFLIEITSNILKYKTNGQPLVTKIRDSAGQVNIVFSLKLCS